MKVLAGGVEWNVEVAGNPDNPALLLLHGFTGTWRVWAESAKLLADEYFLIMPDLPGHGDSPVNAALSLWALGAATCALFSTLAQDRIAICGYSMGGRITLHALLTKPQHCRSLILMSTSSGIPNEHERAKRKASDAELADELLKKGHEWFTAFWESQPILASQKQLNPELRAEIMRSRYACPLDGLATALRLWSAGMQDDLAPRLGEICCPVLLLAGEHDPKYSASNLTLRSEFSHPNVTSEIISAAAHALPWEQPAAVAAAMRNFLHTVPSPIS